MPEMFGTTEGLRAYERDAQELALIAGQADHQRALSELNRSQARRVDAGTAKDTAAAGMMSKIFAGGEAKPQAADPFDQLIGQFQQVATVLAQTGDLDGAEKAAKTAGTLTSNVAAANAARALETRRHAQTAIQQMEVLQQRFAGVASPEAHAQALMLTQSDPLFAGVKLPSALLQYNPGALRAFVANSPAAIARRKLQLEESDAARKQADSESLRAQRQVLADLQKQRTDAYVGRQERIAKNDGGSAVKPVAAASSGEVSAVRNILKEMGFDAGTAGNNVAARAIADEAKLLHHRNPAISINEARAQAVREAQARGELKTVPFLRDQYKPTEGSYSRPLALPKSKAELIHGRYYRGAGGRIEMYVDPDEGASENPLTGDKDD